MQLSGERVTFETSDSVLNINMKENQTMPLYSSYVQN